MTDLFAMFQKPKSYLSMKDLFSMFSKQDTRAMPNAKKRVEICHLPCSESAPKSPSKSASKSAYLPISNPPVNSITKPLIEQLVNQLTKHLIEYFPYQAKPSAARYRRRPELDRPWRSIPGTVLGEGLAVA